MGLGRHLRAIGEFEEISYETVEQILNLFPLNSGPNVLRLSRGVINIGSAGSIFLRCVKHRSSFNFFRNVLQIAK